MIAERVFDLGLHPVKIAGIAGNLLVVEEPLGGRRVAVAKRDRGRSAGEFLPLDPGAIGGFEQRSQFVDPAGSFEQIGKRDQDRDVEIRRIASVSRRPAPELQKSGTRFIAGPVERLTDAFVIMVERLMLEPHFGEDFRKQHSGHGVARIAGEQSLGFGPSLGQLLRLRQSADQIAPDRQFSGVEPRRSAEGVGRLAPLLEAGQGIAGVAPCPPVRRIERAEAEPCLAACGIILGAIGGLRPGMPQDWIGRVFALRLDGDCKRFAAAAGIDQGAGQHHSEGQIRWLDLGRPAKRRDSVLEPPRAALDQAQQMMSGRIAAIGRDDPFRKPSGIIQGAALKGGQRIAHGVGVGHSRSLEIAAVPVKL